MKSDRFLFREFQNPLAVKILTSGFLAKIQFQVWIKWRIETKERVTILRPRTIYWLLELVFLKSNKLSVNIHVCCFPAVKVKCRAIPVTNHEGPQGCETSMFLHFLYTIGSQVTVSLSDLRAGRPLPPRGTFLVIIFIRGWVDPRAILRLERLGRSKKNPPHRDSNPPPSGL
jgi:hypothetical protein